MAKMKEVLVRLKQYITKESQDRATAINNLNGAKADKVVNGTENNIVLLDANGNIKDSGKSLADTGKIDSVSIDGTTVQPDANKNVDLPAYPTRVSLLINNVDNTSDANKPVSTAQQAAIDSTGHKIDLEINNTNFKMKAKLYDKDNNLISTSTEIDLPLESVVVGGSYEPITKQVILTLQNGTTIAFSVADLIYGLQSEITANNPLSSDLVDDTNGTHKFVSQQEKTNWDNKVDGGVVEVKLRETWVSIQPKLKKECIRSNGGYIDKSGFTNILVTKSWAGNSQVYGSNIWTDGENIYHNITGNSGLQLVNGAWVNKTWSGLNSFEGRYVWTDGENIYYSYSNTQKQLVNGEWIIKTWTGLTGFYGSNIWTDGENIYYSYSNTQKQLVNGAWVNKTWSGLTDFNAYNIWTDGENIYFSNNNATNGTTGYYVLNKTTGEWVEKTWNIGFAGSSVWTDGINIYCYNPSSDKSYILNKATSTWTVMEWSEKPSNFGSTAFWTDGENIYYSAGSSQQFVLEQKAGQFLFEDINDYPKRTDLSDVAFSGDYEDLINKPSGGATKKHDATWQMKAKYIEVQGGDNYNDIFQKEIVFTEEHSNPKRLMIGFGFPHTKYSHNVTYKSSECWGARNVNYDSGIAYFSEDGEEKNIDYYLGENEEIHLPFWTLYYKMFNADTFAIEGEVGVLKTERPTGKYFSGCIDDLVGKSTLAVVDSAQNESTITNVFMNCFSSDDDRRKFFTHYIDNPSQASSLPGITFMTFEEGIQVVLEEGFEATFAQLFNFDFFADLRRNLKSQILKELLWLPIGISRNKIKNQSSVGAVRKVFTTNNYSCGRTRFMIKIGYTDKNNYEGSIDAQSTGIDWGKQYLEVTLFMAKKFESFSVVDNNPCADFSAQLVVNINPKTYK